jgi:hypothetical protein
MANSVPSSTSKTTISRSRADWSNPSRNSFDGGPSSRGVRNQELRPSLDDVVMTDPVFPRRVVDIREAIVIRNPGGVDRVLDHLAEFARRTALESGAAELIRHASTEVIDVLDAAARVPA